MISLIRWLAGRHRTDLPQVPDGEVYEVRSFLDVFLDLGLIWFRWCYPSRFLAHELEVVKKRKKISKDVILVPLVPTCPRFPRVDRETERQCGCVEDHI